VSEDQQRILHSREEQRDGVLALARQASSRILILSEELEPYLYNNAEFIDACRQMVIRHERCHVHILVKSTENLKKMDHRLLPLLQRLPSRMALKVCHVEDRDYPETFMLADSRGIFLKRVPGRSPALQNPDNPRLNAEYVRQFEGFWDRADTDMSLVRLAL
jgi:hypothetical protein